MVKEIQALMTAKYYLTFFLFILLSSQIKAQESQYYISRLIDSQTKEVVPNANIVNLNNKRGTTSNLLGYFMIKAFDKDYIKVSYVGYNYLYIQVDYSISDTIDIFLYKKTYELEEVEVLPWTKQEFKHQFIYREFPSDTLEWLKSRYLVSKEELIWLTPVSFHNYKTSKERQEIKLRKLKKWLEKDRVFRDAITEMCGYEGVELEGFIRFCSFSKNYISNAREYYLKEAIHRKCIEFDDNKNTKE